MQSTTTTTKDEQLSTIFRLSAHALGFNYEHKPSPSVAHRFVNKRDNTIRYDCFNDREADETINWLMQQ